MLCYMILLIVLSNSRYYYFVLIYLALCCIAVLCYPMLFYALLKFFCADLFCAMPFCVGQVFRSGEAAGGSHGRLLLCDSASVEGLQQPQRVPRDAGDAHAQ